MRLSDQVDEAILVLGDASGYLKSMYRDDDDVDEAISILDTLRERQEQRFECRHCGKSVEWVDGYCSSLCYKADQL